MLATRPLQLAAVVHLVYATDLIAFPIAARTAHIAFPIAALLSALVDRNEFLTPTLL
jgi:hypothetical protein